jgi:hypothetical protein
VTGDVARDIVRREYGKGDAAGTYWYEGAEDVDFAALKARWDALTLAEKEAEMAFFGC